MMTTQRSQPDFLVLWQYIEGELEPSQAGEIEAYLANSPEGRSQIERLERFALILDTVLADASPSSRQVRTAACPSPEIVIAFAERVLAGEERNTFERHLRTCDGCLHAVMEARQMDAMLEEEEDLPMPLALKARVESLWKRPAPEFLPRVVIGQFREGVKQRLSVALETIGASLAAVHEIAVLQPAMRSDPGESKRDEEVLAMIGFQGEDKDKKAILEGTVARKGNERFLTLQFFDADRNPLMAARVTLSQHGEVIYSDETDSSGKLEVSDIELSSGAYVVECVPHHTKFELVLP